MDILNNETLSYLLLHYGGFALFVLLAFGIIALPIPEETLMIFTGILMEQGHLRIPTTILWALAGSISGITLSYLVGRTGGSYLIHRYGRFVGIEEQHLQKAKEWFDHFGKWTLFIGYFIPGLRHFTGFTAGVSGVEYRHFAFFAYAGAIVWVSLFLTLGYFFSDYCVNCIKYFEFHSGALFVIGALLLLLSFVFIKKYFLR